MLTIYPIGYIINEMPLRLLVGGNGLKSLERKLELVGGRLEEMLRQKDITRKAISEASGVDESIIAKIINGVRTITLDQMAAIWFAAGCYVTRRQMLTPEGRVLCTG